MLSSITGISTKRSNNFTSRLSHFFPSIHIAHNIMTEAPASAQAPLNKAETAKIFLTARARGSRSGIFRIYLKLADGYKESIRIRVIQNTKVISSKNTCRKIRVYMASNYFFTINVQSYFTELIF